MVERRPAHVPVHAHLNHASLIGGDQISDRLGQQDGNIGKDERKERIESGKLHEMIQGILLEQRHNGIDKPAEKG